MEDRDAAVRADVLILRTLAELSVSILDTALVKLGLNDGLISQKNQATILHGLYAGVVELATRLGDKWDEALMLTRGTCRQGSSDSDTLAAFNKLVSDTEHLYTY